MPLPRELFFINLNNSWNAISKVWRRNVFFYVWQRRWQNLENARMPWQRTCIVKYLYCLYALAAWWSTLWYRLRLPPRRLEFMGREIESCQDIRKNDRNVMLMCAQTYENLWKNTTATLLWYINAMLNQINMYVNTTYTIMHTTTMYVC
jgi:hypothetical protein